MSTFVLGTDDPDVVRRYAVEVAPAVRDLVDAERARRARGRRAGAAPPATPVRPRAAPADGTPLTVRATPDDGVRLSADAPLARGRPSRDRRARARGILRRRAGGPAAPRRRARPPARRAGPAARHRRPGAARRDVDRGRTVGHQHDGDAAEQLDARRLLRDVLPARHRPPHPRGPEHLRAPARRASPTSARSSTGSSRSTTSSPTCSSRSTTPSSGSSGATRYGRAGQDALDEIQRALDLLTDTLLSHLAYEERELLHPLARHGFG